jgi:hypothetical protein
MKSVTMGAGRIASIALCLALAACASTGDDAPTILGDPGKYQYHSCEQLTAAGKAMAVRQKELQTLIGKAEEGAAGAFVGAIAYRTDYVAATEDIRLIRVAVRDKKCVTAPTWLSNTAIQ